jgi:hypothetical protein
MNGVTTKLRHLGPEVRLLTAEEIDLVTGGGHSNHGGALATIVANALAGGNSTFTQALTRTYAFNVGNVSIAFGFGFGIAIGVGPGSTAVVSIGASAGAQA